eukprot:scaffold304450_cov17-Tisochrysis_lutea.AAC.2
MHRPTIAAGTPIARRALGEALENEAAAASRAQGQLSVQGQMPVQGQQGPPHTMQPNPWGPNYRPPSNPQPADILHWQPQQDQGEHGGDLLSDLQRGNDVSRRVRPRNPEGVNMNAGYLPWPRMLEACLTAKCLVPSPSAHTLTTPARLKHGSNRSAFVQKKPVSMH